MDYIRVPAKVENFGFFDTVAKTRSEWHSHRNLSPARALKMGNKRYTERIIYNVYIYRVDGRTGGMVYKVFSGVRGLCKQDFLRNISHGN